MPEHGEEREMWTCAAGEEPVAGVWAPLGESHRFWACGGWVGAEGVDLFPTRDAAIRHAIEEAERDREVMLKAASVANERAQRLYRLLERG